MPRIADLSSQQLITSRMLSTQQRLFEAQIQITSGDKTQVYSGLSSQSQRLITMENTEVRLQKYIETNEVLNTRLDAAQTATQGITDNVSEFKEDLLKFPTGTTPTAEDVSQTQSWAFNMLKDIQALLNQDVDGQYLFAGSSRQTEPVDLGLTTLEAFQEKYDGDIVKYPETRAAHLANFEISEDSAATPTTDWINFEASTGRLWVPSGSTLFSNVAAGTTIDISGTTGGTNDGTYTVSAVSGAEISDETIASAGVTVTEIGVGALAGLGTLTFDNANQTLQTSTGAGFASLTAGDQISIDGTSGNDGVYEVTAMNGANDTATLKMVTGTYLEVNERQFIDETTLTGVQTDTSNDTAATITLPDGTTIDSNQYGFLNFDGTSDTIDASGVDAFHSVEDGDIITVSGHTNTALNGKYLVTEDPINTNRSLRVQPAHTLSAPNGTSLDVNDVGPLTFDQSANTISVGGSFAGTLASIPVGQTVTVAGTLNNDGSYKVLSNDGSTITVEMDNITDSAATGPATIKADNYYNGDTLQQDYRISDHRTVDLNLNAVDPGFEKVIRALSIIAQGEYGSAGGLDQNTDRIDDALYLLKDAINQPTGGVPPYGTEETGSIEYLQFEMGFVQKRISDANDRHTNDSTYLLNNAGNIEDTDMAEAITNLQLEAQALEASYRVFSRFQELSLSNYL